MSDEAQIENRCCLCLESQDNKIHITLVCGHSMDYNCFLNIRRPSCPLCRKEIDTPTQFLPPEFVFLPREEDEMEIPTPPPAPTPLLQRQHAQDFTLDITDLLQPRSPFPSEWFRQNRFILHEVPPERRRRRHQERRQRQRDTRRRYNQFRPSQEEFLLD
jgi:hypothetical protein